MHFTLSCPTCSQSGTCRSAGPFPATTKKIYENSTFFCLLLCLCLIVVHLNYYMYVLLIFCLCIYWSFLENTSVKQSMKHKVCSNFQRSFLHLSQMDPLIEASSGQSGTMLGLVALSLDVPHQYRHMVTKSGTKLGLVDLSSVVPPVEASSGQEQYYIRSAWHLVSLWVRLTFGKMYPSRGI